MRCGALRAGSFGRDRATRGAAAPRRCRIPRCVPPHAWPSGDSAWTRWRPAARAVAVGRAGRAAAAAQALTELSPDVLAELDTCLRPEANPSGRRSHALGDPCPPAPWPALEPRVLGAGGEAEAPPCVPRRARAMAQDPRIAPRSEVLAAPRARRPRTGDPAGNGSGSWCGGGQGRRSVSTLVALLGTADSLRFHVIRALGQCHGGPGRAVRLRDLSR